MPSYNDDLKRRLESETWEESGRRPPVDLPLVPGLTILHHPEVFRVGDRALLTGLSSGQEERLSRVEPLFSSSSRTELLPLADPYVSRQPMRFLPGSEPGSVRLERAESATRVMADGEDVAAEREFPAAAVERGVVLLLADQIVLLLSLLDPSGSLDTPDFGLVGESAAMIQLRREIRLVARLKVPVLLRGETGTGKELVARALHESSPRRSHPWQAINMAAIPPTLAASELFGAARGAYTGADRKHDGYFQRAEGGTLFLDEIGEAPIEVQALLLRALETGEVQLVGGGELHRVNVRLIAATDADLEGAVAAARFREALLHRLAGYEIRIPPLRRRRDDFGRLFYHFVRAEMEELTGTDWLATPFDASSWIPAALVARLAAYDWPGNIRELQNVVRRLVIAGRDAGETGMWQQVERLLQEAVGKASEEPPSGLSSLSQKRTLRRTYRRREDISEEELLAALRANRWNLQTTAEQLGISRTSLYSIIDKSTGIRKAADLSREEIELCYQHCQGDLDAMAEKLEVSKRGLQRRMKRLGLL